MHSRVIKLPQYQPSSPSVSLLQIGGIDARSVQKTPAGVLPVRRGLFFVKRQRRYAAYLQKGQKGLDTRIVGCTILTAHSSQRELYLDSFLSTFYKHTYFFPVYTQKQTVKSIPRFQDSAVHLVSIQLLIMNYEFIISYKFHSALSRNSRQVVWFDTG